MLGLDLHADDLGPRAILPFDPRAKAPLGRCGLPRASTRGFRPRALLDASRGAAGRAICTRGSMRFPEIADCSFGARRVGKRVLPPFVETLPGTRRRSRGRGPSTEGRHKGGRASEMMSERLRGNVRGKASLAEGAGGVRTYPRYSILVDLLTPTSLWRESQDMKSDSEQIYR